MLSAAPVEVSTVVLLLLLLGFDGGPMIRPADGLKCVECGGRGVFDKYCDSSVEAEDCFPPKDKSCATYKDEDFKPTVYIRKCSAKTQADAIKDPCEFVGLAGQLCGEYCYDDNCNAATNPPTTTTTKGSPLDDIGVTLVVTPAPSAAVAVACASPLLVAFAVALGACLSSLLLGRV